MVFFLNKNCRFWIFKELINVDFRDFNMSYHASFEKVYNGHLESRKQDSVWAEWVPNTFPFCNLTPELRFLDSRLVFYLLFW